MFNIGFLGKMIIYLHIIGLNASETIDRWHIDNMPLAWLILLFDI